MSGDDQAAVPAQPMPSGIYTISEMVAELRQAEILTNVHQFSVDRETLDITTTVHNFCIIVTQDCDLLQEFERRAAGKPSDLNSIMLYEVQPSDQCRMSLPGGDIWRRVRDNREDRYHLLQRIPAHEDLLEQGISTLVIDFKKMFSITPNDLYEQLKRDDGAKRRCRLDMPFREHLQNRAAAFFQRVMLPHAHAHD